MEILPQPTQSNFKDLLYLLSSTLRAKGNFAEGIRRLLVRHGKLSLPLKLGSLHLWITVDPEEVRRILIKQTDRFQKIPLEKKVLEPVMRGGLILLEGREWRDHREAMAPCFDSEQMAALIRISDEAYSRSLQELEWPCQHQPRNALHHQRRDGALFHGR